MDGARSLHPFDDGLRVVEHMIVNRVPDINVPAQRPERIVVDTGFRQDVSRFRRMRKLLAERLKPGYFAHQKVRRLIEIVRHLHCKYAALRQLADEAFDLREVIRHPLEDGVCRWDESP